jgi:hypothetical protein
MEIEASAENLKQILRGVTLESGARRGVGPNLQKKLEAKYPGWSRLAESPDVHPVAMDPSELALLTEFRRLKTDILKGRAIERLATMADAQDQAPQLGGEITPMGSRQPRRVAGA